MGRQGKPRPSPGLGHATQLASPEVWHPAELNLADGEKCAIMIAAGSGQGGRIMRKTCLLWAAILVVVGGALAEAQTRTVPPGKNPYPIGTPARARPAAAPQPRPRNARDRQPRRSNRSFTCRFTSTIRIGARTALVTPTGIRTGGGRVICLRRRICRPTRCSVRNCGRRPGNRPRSRSTRSAGG